MRKAYACFIMDETVAKLNEILHEYLYFGVLLYNFGHVLSLFSISHSIICTRFALEHLITFHRLRIFNFKGIPDDYMYIT